MMRLSPPGFKRFSQTYQWDVVYGGGESNVAVSLANYGLNTYFVSRIPANDIGECAIMELKKRSVNTDYIARGGERLGIYFSEMGAVSRGSKVIYDRAYSGMASITSGMINWEEVFKDADSASHNTWSGVLYDGEKLYEAPTYEITHIVDRVGGGDSFMAGLIYGLLNFQDDQKALNFAVAASCLKHTIIGDANLATIQEVEALMAGNKSGRISR